MRSILPKSLPKSLPRSLGRSLPRSLPRNATPAVVAVVGALLLAVTAPAAAAAAALAGPGDPPPVTPQIVGGRPASEPYPFAASLQSRGGGHFCGAALIRPDWLVTARHCVEGDSPGSIQARIGSPNRTSGGTVATIRRIVLHPAGPSDVAVLQLTAPVPHTPISIPAGVPVGSAIRLLGWGATSDPNPGPPPVQLQELDTTVLPDSQCGTGGPELCVGNVDGWRGACYGDSGGPAVLRGAGGWQLAGTTTAGTTRICGQGPSIYMDSAAHRAWIDSVVGTTPPPPGKYFENTADVAIPDFGRGAVESPITVSGVPGSAPAALRVGVDIKHTWRGDLTVDVVAPDGSAYRVHNRSGGSADNVIATFTVNASAETAGGTWRLRVQDHEALDVGFIDKWSLEF
jgi:Trypsin/Proprotein convertase P-domain